MKCNNPRIVLLSPYEIGRQPFSLAQPAAWLKREGFEVDCIDLAVEPFESSRIEGASLVAIHLVMHAGARLAVQVVSIIAEKFPNIPLCIYGLYAPVNDDYFRSLGVRYVLGGESEPDLVELCKRLQNKDTGNGASQTIVRLDKIEFAVPDRSGLPELREYSKVVMPDNNEKVVGFVEASRGCKHLCRHCPVVPVYSGKFRVVPIPIVLADLRQQVEAGAQHISFGDPDFLNGPTHARRIVDAMHAEFPHLTWDATVKIEHLLQNQDLLAEFSRKRCSFLTSAVESIENDVLVKLQKGHTAADFKDALKLLRDLGIAMVPTFVPFTPWTTLAGYKYLLETIIQLKLVHAVAPVQLCIRLLLPQGSRLLELDDCSEWLEGFHSELLGYQWHHPDQRVDQLQEEIQSWVLECEETNRNRPETFAGIWLRANRALNLNPEPVPEDLGPLVPRMTEPWYCCAEPTETQLMRNEFANSPAV